MRARCLRILISLAILVAAYWAYALVAVPLIEPQFQRASVRADYSSPPIQDHHFEHLLPPGSWELDQPKVLETDDGMLLFKDYETRSDGCMRLSPLTLIFHPDGGSGGRGAMRPGASGDQQVRPVIMRAPDGAILRFEDPLDLARAKIGRLLGGALEGRIVIESPESRPGAGDALQVLTQKVQIDRQRVWTTHPVEFRYGQSFGSGRELVVELAPEQDRGGQQRRLAPMGGVKSLELVHVDKVHIQFDSARQRPGESTQSEEQAIGQLRRSEDASPTPGQPVLVDVACSGSFRFDFEKLVASFEDNVEVVRLHPDGPSDRLTCERLAVHLARAPDSHEGLGAGAGGQRSVAGRHGAGPRWSALRLDRIVADGRPVQLRAPSAGASAQGERLEYNVWTSEILLADGKGATFEQGGRVIEAPQLRYGFDPADPGRLTRLWASGPGRVLAPGDGKSASQIEAAWQEELRFEPDGSGRILSLVSQARVSRAGFGSLAAGTIRLWLLDVAEDCEPQRPREGSPTEPRPPAAVGPPQPAIADPWRAMAPARMQAFGDVVVESQQLAGRTDRLEIWFRRPEGGSHQQAAAADPQTGTPAPAASVEQWGSNRRDEKLDVSGALVQAQVFLGKPNSLEHLTIRGDVHVRQMTASPKRPPLRIDGDLLQLDDVRAGTATGQVAGSPARVSAGGLSMASNVIQLDQGANRLWIDQPGEMALLPTAPVALRGVRDPRPTTVAWSGRMDFDGAVAHFLRDVEVRGVQLLEDGGANDVTARGGVLDIELTRRIDFAKPQQSADVAARLFTFPAGISVENQSCDKLGVPQSHDRLEARSMNVDVPAGQLAAVGPGWVSSVRYGRKLLQDAGRNSRPVRSQPGSSQLNYLRVEFQKGIGGDLFKREVTFRDRVSVIYGPVSGWDEQLDGRRREGLGERDVLLDCNILKVADLGPPGGGRRSIELEASGNTTVQGRTFVGRGGRIKYVEAKDMLVLESDGRSDAVLARQSSPGQPPAEVRARTITYWLSSRDVMLGDVRSLNLDDLRSTKVFPQRNVAPQDALPRGGPPH